MDIFMQATIAIPMKGKDGRQDGIECYPISNLNSTLVQLLLRNIEETDLLRIKDLGLLRIREIHLAKSHIVFWCKKIGEYDTVL